MQKSFIDKLTWVQVKEKKVLFLLSKGKDIWLTPGGKREEGESDEQALIREIKEELTVDLHPQTIQYFHTFEDQAAGKPEGTMVKLTCYTADYTGDLQPHAEIADMKYFASDTKAQLSKTGIALLRILKEKGLIE